MKNSDKWKSILEEIARREMNVPDPQIFNTLKMLAQGFQAEALAEETVKISPKAA